MAERRELLLGAEELHKRLRSVPSHDRLQQGKVVAGCIQGTGGHLPASGIGIGFGPGIGGAEIEVVVREELQDVRVDPGPDRPGHPVFHRGADIHVRKAAEERFRQVVRGAGLAPVVAGGYDPRALRQRPAVVHKALQDDLENDRLRLLCRVGKLVEEENVRLAVAAEALQAHQPRGLDVHDLVLGFVVDRAAVDGLGGLVHQLDVQSLRVDLTHTVGLSVAGETVDKHRDVRLDIGPDQAELIMFHKAEGAFFRKLILRLGCEFGEERPIQIRRALLPVPSAE